ncbi:hypothetical protein STFE110948_07100 [Streptobacillus felis]|uniref:Uncharacterized protein n=1 Tax=Streptobacillus felis TaxID=1384509 RepID=A0A7Z0TBK8_9FUSO|nr:hypothetical protein [Streptobacillus felis]NYV27473.1 hypothetical protein [Streptobacillus felis]
MYSLEDFNKDFEQVKETLKGVDVNTGMDLVKSNLGNFTDKLNGLFNENQITKEELSTYLEKIKEFAKQYLGEEVVNGITAKLEGALGSILKTAKVDSLLDAAKGLFGKK